MNSNTSTSPNIVKAIFPLKGNESSADKAAVSFGVIAYPEKNMLFFKGCLKDFHSLAEILKGGVIA